MKKTFFRLTTITFLLFNVFSINLSAQCTILTRQTTFDAVIATKTVGQSWTSDCANGTYDVTITIKSGDPNSDATGVILRIWENNVPAIGSQMVIYTQAGLTIPKGVETAFDAQGVPLKLGVTYYFTFTSASNVNLASNTIGGTYAGGQALSSSDEFVNTTSTMNLVLALLTTDLYFILSEPSQIPLPIELTNFKASKSGNQSLLAWTTSSESDNQHFAIERSKDGKNFKEIGIVNSKGASYEKQDYTFIDPTPAKGFNYYRLKQVDFNGKYDYSKVEMVALKGFAEVMLYPNPAKESITIETSATDKHDVKIMDYMGRIWLSKTLENDVNQLNIASLPKGLYFLESYIDNELVRKNIVKE